MSDNNAQTQRLDHLGIIAGVCDEIDLVERIDAKVPSRMSGPTVGQAVRAMVLNALGFVGRPLYLTPEFFHNKPVDELVGAGLSAEDLNEHNLGRALDALFKAGITEVFVWVVQHALQVFGIDVRTIRLDSTTFSLHGEYATDNVEQSTTKANENVKVHGAVAVPDDGAKRQGDAPEREALATTEAEPTPIHITYGYSKDKRPDLKQAVLNLITANNGTLPLWLAALDGNTSDNKSFPKAVKAFTEQLGADVTAPLLVVDAAVYSQENLPQISADGVWLSRVPASLKLVRELKAEVPLEAMRFISDQHAIWEWGSFYGGVKQRWLLVYHVPTARKDQHKLQARIDKERQRAQRRLKRLRGREFACREDAEAALAQENKSLRFHQLSGQAERRTRYLEAGRPTPNSPTREVWHLSGNVVQDDAAITRENAACGKYVLATNQLDELALPAEAMLDTYRQQSTSVERGFRFLKDPLFFAHSLFLKKPARIMALLMVMCLSLLVYSLAEQRFQQALYDSGDTLPDQKGQPTRRLTLRRVFQMFEGIDVLHIVLAGKQQRLILNLNELHRQILGYFGPHVQKYYVAPT